MGRPLSFALSLLAVLLVSAEAQITHQETELLNWVQREGGELKVTISRNADGLRGLYTAEAVKSGDDLVTLPRHLALPLPGTDNPEEGSPFLLRELHIPCSRYRPYLDALPTSSEEVTGYSFPEQYIPYLADETLESTVRDSFIDHVRKMYDGRRDNDLYMSIPEAVGGANISLSYLQHVMSLSTTRGFNLRHRGLAMLPIIDMVNHHPGEHSIVNLEDRAVIRLVANRDFEAGEEVTFTYGHFHPDESLLYYGFIDTSDNPHRMLAVDLRTTQGPDDHHPRRDEQPLTGPIEEVRSEISRLEAILERFEARLAALGPVPDTHPHVAGLLRRLHRQRTASLNWELVRLRDIVFKHTRGMEL